MAMNVGIFFHNRSSIAEFKISSAIGLLFATALASFAPFKLVRMHPERTHRILSFMSFMNAGVFLGSGLLHLLPDAIEAQSKAGDPAGKFPIALFTVCLGFVCVWALEKISLTSMPSQQLLAVTAGATGIGADLCYVKIDSVVSYGSLGSDSDKEVPSRASNLPTSPLLVPVMQLDGAVHVDEHGNRSDCEHNDNINCVNENENQPLLNYGVERDTTGTETILSPSNNNFVSKFSSERKCDTPLKIDCTHDINQFSGFFVDKKHCCSHSKYRHYLTNENNRNSRPEANQENEKGEAHISNKSDICFESSSPQESSRLLQECASSQTGREKFFHRFSPASTTNATSQNATPPKLLLPNRSEFSNHDHVHDSIHHHHTKIGGNALLPVALAAVFSIHSFIEGSVLGISPSINKSTVSVLFAISAHKVVEAMSVSSNFVKENVSFQKTIPIIAIYCFMTPLGLLVGWLAEDFVTGSKSIFLQSELQAFASGSFVYLAMHEAGDEECCHQVPKLYQLLLMLFGLGIMAILALWS